MTPEVLVNELKTSKEYLDRSSRCLKEADSTFSPAEGALTPAQQMAHIAQSVEWFMEGAFGAGFDMNFDNHMAQFLPFTSLKKARAWVDKAYADAIRLVESKTAAQMLEPIADQPIMSGMPKLTVVYGIVEHTAHHRGALTIYSRMRGYTPAMPYMETEPAAS